MNAPNIDFVLDLAEGLTEIRDVDAALSEVARTAEKALAADRVAIWLLDSRQGELRLVVPQRKARPRVDSSLGLLGICLQRQESLDVADLRGEPGYDRRADGAAGPGARALMNVPIRSHGRLFGVLQVLKREKGPFGAGPQRVAGALAAYCAVILQSARLNEALAGKKRLDEEVDLARRIQLGTLPETMPVVPGYDLHARFIPTGRAGGDIYDLVMLDGRLFMLIGDATGHGFGPALSATQMQAMLRVAFRCGAGLDEAYRHVNNQLAEDLPDDRFITAFMGFLDPGTHRLAFHSGGQGPILHFRAQEGICDLHAPTGFPLGAMSIERTGEARHLTMQPGDVLALVSDGLYEYADESGEPFGEARVAEVLKGAYRRPIRALAAALLDGAREHGQGKKQQDDITMLLIRRLDSGRADDADRREGA